MSNVASLPFRFKAGGDGKMSPAVVQHSHRPTTKVANKPFKSRHATKGALRNAAKGMKVGPYYWFIIIILFFTITFELLYS